MHPEIKQAYLEGRLMLLLGAGASAQSTDKTGISLPTGNGLASEIAQSVGLEYSGETLSQVYSAVSHSDGARLHQLFRNRLVHTRPGGDVLALAAFRWQRVYTLNIDDVIETAFRKTSPQRLRVFGRNDPLEDADPIFEEVQIIKLNGSADRPQDGFIFSPQEYASGSLRFPAWYKEVGQDYSQYVFVFIGSKLNEPLFQHVMADARLGNNREPQRGFVITPSASAIEKKHLEALNLVHVSGVLDDFVKWLKAEVGKPPSGWELATAKRPELKSLTKTLPAATQRALNAVLVVGRKLVPNASVGTEGRIRDFYRGFKPTWQDIGDGVPANLAAVRGFSKKLIETDAPGKAIALLGPAGSGKTTTLMSAALTLSSSINTPVYYLREPVSDLYELVVELERLNQNRYHLFVDRADLLSRDIALLFEERKVSRGTIVFSERSNVWNRRLHDLFGTHVAEKFEISRISKADIPDILKKLKAFGPWTRLEKLTEEQQKAEIYEKSSRQLLIGLMEATSGIGFNEIIRRDFRDIGDDNHKKFLIIVGLSTIHRSALGQSLAGRALIEAGVDVDVTKLLGETEGIIFNSGGKLSARHPIYIRELFERIANPEMIRNCLVALLKAFSDFQAPVIQHVNKADGVVFKSIINHRFIRQMMRNDEIKVRSIYEAFETVFHVDGLYWLQYGLALRGFGHHEEAMDRFKTAKVAYSSPQIEHAYALQLIILAERSFTWDDAEPLLSEAVNNFRNQRADTWETDTYPIVSLAEGHVAVYKKFHSLEQSQALARQYANELQKTRQRTSNARLEEAILNMTLFATTGVWKEQRPVVDESWES